MFSGDHSCFGICHSLCDNVGLSLYRVASTVRVNVKVEPYSIPGPFLKLKYLKTELNVDNDTYATV